MTELATPTGGVPPVIDTPEQLHHTIAALAGGTGPVAVDAERAHSFRYSPKSYLFQLRRTGSGTHVIDPIAFENGDEVADLSPITTALGDAEWIIHAATQDLPCLVETGLRPTRLFDTELAGRLLGLPRVALGLMIEQYFGLHLLKEHSAADWSTRPIPADWVAYAALDVELLIDLRQILADQLIAAGKDEWARQEFAYLIQTAGRHDERPERWRRTSGTHTVRTQRGLAIVRELWTVRDSIAKSMDKAPSKIVQDSAITELASMMVPGNQRMPGKAELRHVDGFGRREAKRHEGIWLDALQRAAQLSQGELPPLRLHSNSPPPPRTWQRINPSAWQRWTLIRPAIIERAEALQLPVENLMNPEQVRLLAWQPPADLSPESVDEQLATGQARPWQRELVVPLVTPLLRQAAAAPHSASVAGEDATSEDVSEDVPG